MMAVGKNAVLISRLTQSRTTNNAPCVLEPELPSSRHCSRVQRIADIAHPGHYHAQRRNPPLAGVLEDRAKCRSSSCLGPGALSLGRGKGEKLALGELRYALYSLNN